MPRKRSTTQKRSEVKKLVDSIAAWVRRDQPRHMYEITQTVGEPKGHVIGPGCYRAGAAL